MYCSNCGKEIPDNTRFCFHCGANLQQETQKSTEQRIQELAAQPASSNSQYSYKTAQILAMIPIPGLHRFYLGTPGSAFAQFISFPFFVGIVWWLIDNLRLLTNNYKDKEGRPLAGYSKTYALISLVIWVSLLSNAIVNGINAPSKVNEASTDSVVSVSSEDSSNPEVCTEQEKPSHVAIIKENAVVSISPERAQEIDSLYGEGKSAQIQQLLPIAAKLVSEHKNCDEVVKADFDDVYSTPGSPKIYVLCQNKKEVTFTLPELEQNIKVTDNRFQSPKYRAPIRAGAVFKYPETKTGLIKAGFPKMLKKLGLDNIKKANKLLPFAARKAAQSTGCDAVMSADISDKSTKEKLVFYVHAENYTKFYFTEAELLTETPTVSEQERLAPLLIRHEVLAEEVIKSKLNYPSTYDRHELGVFTSRTTPNCNEITIEFSAKNAYNLELTYIATVQFDKDSNVVGFYMQEKR